MEKTGLYSFLYVNLENACIFTNLDERRFNLIVKENFKVYHWPDICGCNGIFVTRSFCEHFRKIKKMQPCIV